MEGGPSGIDRNQSSRSSVANSGSRITRRELLRIAAGAAASLFLPAPLRAAGTGGSFIIITDLHHNCSECCRTWLASVISSIQALSPQPEFCVLAGDLSEHGSAAEIGEVRDAFSSLSMPLFPIIGNHDYPESSDASVFQKVFPEPLNYRFEHRGWQFVALDSTDGQGVFWTRVQPEPLAWLDKHVPRLSPHKPIAILTHFPLGRTLVRPRNAGAVLSRFRTTDLREVFSGHWHGSTRCRIRRTTLTTSRCCSLLRANFDRTPEKGYLLCRPGERNIRRQFVRVAAAS